MIKKTHKLNKKNKKNITQKYVGGGLGHTIPMAITIKSWKGLSLAQVFFLVQGPPPDSAPGAPGNCFIIFNLFKGLMNKASSLARGVTLGVGNVVSSTLTGKTVEQKSATALIIDQLIKKDIGLSSTSKQYYGGNEKYYTGGKEINFAKVMLLLPFAPIIMVLKRIDDAEKFVVNGLKRITASDSFTSNTNFTAKSIFFIFDIDEKTNTLLYNLGTGYSSPNKYDEKNPGEYFKGLALPMMDDRFYENKPYLLDYEKFYRHNQKSKIELIIKPATKETETETILKYWRIENANDIFKFKWKNRITGKESDTIPEEIMTDEIKTKAETPEAWIKSKISYFYPKKIYWRNKFTGIKSDKLPEVFYADENYKELVKKNWKLVDTGNKNTIPETKWENKETGETSKTIPEIIFTEDLKKQANSVDAWIKKIIKPRYNYEIEFYWKNKITGEIARKIPPILLTNELKIESEKAESWVPQITPNEETDTLSVMWGQPKYYTEYPIANWINIITGEISKDAPVIIKNNKEIKVQKCPSSRISRRDNNCLINWFGEKSGEVFYNKLQHKLKQEIDKINNQIENIPVSSEDIQLEEKITENQIAPTSESSKTADTSILSIPGDTNNTGKCAEKQKPHCEDPNNLHPGEDKNACITRRINKKCGKHCIKHVTKKCNKKHDDKHKLEKCIKKHSKRCY
jgi:hypothetical protein